MLFVPPSIPYMVPEAEAQAAQLTMNSPNIDECGPIPSCVGDWDSGISIVRYNPIGDFNFDSFGDYSSCLAVQVLKPDGTEASITTDSACYQHHLNHYNFAGYINDAFNASGWTMKICAPDYNICVEQNFTISFAFLDADTTPPVLTVGTGVAPAILVSELTNSTQSNQGMLQRFFIFNDDGYENPTTCSPGQSLPGNSIIFDYWFPIGATIVTCTATDDAGNVGTVSFPVTITLEDTGDVLITEAEARAAAAGDYWTLEYTGDNIPLNIHVYTNDVLFFTGGERISDIHIVSTPWISTGCTTIGNGGTCIIDFSNWSLGQHEYNTNGGTIGDGNPNTGEGKFTVFEADTTPPGILTVTAYLNATSPTGRTLHVQGSGFSLDAYSLSGSQDKLRVILSSIAKDGASLLTGIWTKIGDDGGGTYEEDASWQIPIPEDWESGTYDIAYDVQAWSPTETLDQGTVSVSIPAAPASYIIITSDKDILDRNLSSDLVTFTITYENLNYNARTIIKTPDGVEHLWGGSKTWYMMDLTVL